MGGDRRLVCVSVCLLSWYEVGCGYKAVGDIMCVWQFLVYVLFVISMGGIEFSGEVPCLCRSYLELQLLFARESASRTSLVLPSNAYLSVSFFTRRREHVRPCLLCGVRRSEFDFVYVVTLLGIQGALVVGRGVWFSGLLCFFPSCPCQYNASPADDVAIHVYVRCSLFYCFFPNFWSAPLRCMN